MSALLKITAGLFLILLVGVIAIQLNKGPGSAASTQKRLNEIAAAALTDAGFAWADVRIDGQKAVLSGEAPSTAAMEEAVDLVRHSTWRGGPVFGGVTAVDASGSTIFDGPPRADPFIWIAERQGDEVIFSGYVPSQIARDEIYKMAAIRFRDAEISGELEIASGSPPEDDWIKAAALSLQALARLETGAVEANGAEFTLNGSAQSSERADSLKRLMAMLPEGIHGTANINISAPDPVIEALVSAIEVETPSVEPESTPIVAAETEAAPDPAEAADECRRRLRDIISKNPIRFASARADIDSSSRRGLSRLAVTMEDCPQFNLEVTGHTDSSGRESRNRQLSRYRADAVAAYLRTVGVDANRIDTRGIGSAEPLVSNNTPAGRTRNRRIEVDLIFDPEE